MAITVKKAKLKKATMLIENTMGATVLRHINLHTIEEKEDEVLIIYKMKGARTLKAYKISKKETQLAFSDEWQTVQGMEKVKCGSYMYNSFLSFGGSFTKALESLKNVSYSHFS